MSAQLYCVPDDDTTPYPVDYQRLETALGALGREITPIKPGRAGRTWIDGVPFVFCFGSSGRFLSIRAQWDTDLDDDEQARTLFAAADSWNREKYFPTVYIRRRQDEFQVCADFVVEISAGLNDRQLTDNLSAAISTGHTAIAYMRQVASSLGWEPVSRRA